MYLLRELRRYNLLKLLVSLTPFASVHFSLLPVKSCEVQSDRYGRHPTLAKRKQSRTTPWVQTSQACASSASAYGRHARGRACRLRGHLFIGPARQLDCDLPRPLRPLAACSVGN